MIEIVFEELKTEKKKERWDEEAKSYFNKNYNTFFF